MATLPTNQTKPTTARAIFKEKSSRLWVYAVAIPCIILVIVWWIERPSTKNQSDTGRPFYTHPGLLPVAPSAPPTFAPPPARGCPNPTPAGENIGPITVGPNAIIINPGKKCYVRYGVESGGSRVEVLDTNGSVIRTMGPEGGFYLEHFEAVRAEKGGQARIAYRLE